MLFEVKNFTDLDLIFGSLDDRVARASASRAVDSNLVQQAAPVRAHYCALIAFS